MPFKAAPPKTRFSPYARDSLVPPAPPGWEWEELMRLALNEAEKAGQLGEVPVGALVVAPDGRILGRGHNSCIHDCDVTAHAEVNALRAAGLAQKNYRLPECILVVTLEPCPLCAAACVYARLAGLVFGAHDALAGAIVNPERPFSACIGTGIWYMGGVLGAECADLLATFFTNLRGA